MTDAPEQVIVCIYSNGIMSAKEKGDPFIFNRPTHEYIRADRVQEMIAAERERGDYHEGWEEGYEAGLISGQNDYLEGWEKGYKAGVLAEREACAKVAVADEEKTNAVPGAEDNPYYHGQQVAAIRIAAAICARG